MPSFPSKVTPGSMSLTWSQIISETQRNPQVKWQGVYRWVGDVEDDAGGDKLNRGGNNGNSRSGPGSKANKSPLPDGVEWTDLLPRVKTKPGAAPGIYNYTIETGKPPGKPQDGKKDGNKTNNLTKSVQDAHRKVAFRDPPESVSDTRSNRGLNQLNGSAANGTNQSDSNSRNAAMSPQSDSHTANPYPPPPPDLSVLSSSQLLEIATEPVEISYKPFGGNINLSSGGGKIDSGRSMPEREVDRRSMLRFKIADD
jgi:hypothetical protein